MSTMNVSDKIELVRNILKDITRGADPGELKEKYREVLAKISPFEIAIIEQQLIREGIKPEEILRVCDIHVDLFREYLKGVELRGVPEGHPLYYLLRENDEIIKLAEALTLYANAVINTTDPEGKKRNYQLVKDLLYKAKSEIRKHYRKNQMLIFPYLERRGIEAVPRVLWGKEDEIIVSIRKILGKEPGSTGEYDENARKVLDLANKIMDLVFRENKILYPAVWILLTPGEWKAIHELAKELGYNVPVEKEWDPGVEPVYPYMVDGTIPRDKLEKLPDEIKRAVGEIKPDNYEIRKPGDVELETGFMNPVEIEEVFRSLPLEITFADENDRVRFFTKSKLIGGFPRSKTIIGRKLEYCHPPRLEGYVKFNVKLLKEGKYPYREFWTRMGSRIIRVLVVGVRDKEGKYLGTLEIVEDFTDIIKNPGEIMRKIVVL